MIKVNRFSDTRTHERFVFYWAMLMGIFLFAAQLSAQSTTTGKVMGTVGDPTGAMVPKAEVQLTNVNTNATQTALTDDSGGFVFPSVVPGEYRITVKMTGFRVASITGLVVDVEKTNTIPVRLEIGGDKEVVEVTARAVF